MFRKNVLRSHLSYKSFLNRSIWPIDETQRRSTTPGQSAPGSNDNEGVHYAPHTSRTEIPLSDVIFLWIKSASGQDFLNFLVDAPVKTKLNT